ncbi:MAG: tetratricopeptide repeat protein [Spirochaetaceae bacterium]|jgi:tetratricopeptide (TPR) repeat protein|nr:tetratricopeptide repeat protein [Spirochaetaceae bacterium]
MKKTIIVLLMALCAVCALAQTLPKTAEEYYNRAVEYHNNGEHNKAIADYTQAIKLNPKYTDAYWNRGNVFYFQKEYDKALSDFTEVIQLLPGANRAYFYRGKIYVLQENYTKGFADYDKAIETGLQDEGLKGNMASDFITYASQLIDGGKYEDALTYLSKALDIGGPSRSAYRRRAQAYLQADKPIAALQDYLQIVHIAAERKTLSERMMGLYFDLETPGIPVVAGAAVYMEMQVGKFLGQDTTRYQSMLHYITGRGNVTQGEIEGFYKQNVGVYVADVVDEEFNKLTIDSWYSKTNTAKVVDQLVKTPLINFMLTPNQNTYEKLRTIDLGFQLNNNWGVYEALLVLRNSAENNMLNAKVDPDLAHHYKGLAKDSFHKIDATYVKQFKLNAIDNVSWQDAETTLTECIELLSPLLAEKLNK